MVFNVISLGDGFRQYSYEFPHRINSAKVYPLTAPNGSPLIIYGHENGLHVVWGRPGRSEEDENEAEPTLASAVHTIDVYLGGAEALCIDFPRLPVNLHHDTKSMPRILSECIVVGVACSDNNIRVISIPMVPAENENGSEQIILLAGEPSHRSIPNRVSVAFTPRQSLKDADLQMNDTHDGAEQVASRPASRGSHRFSVQEDIDWDLLIASASADVSGQIIIHRVPCSKSRIDDSAGYSIPWRVHRLASPAITLSFCSAVYPSYNHLQLLVAEAQGVVRVKDYIHEVVGGRWARSLHIDFSFPGDRASQKPQHILDCRWLLEGKAILVLLSTGEWGIWDIENAEPRTTEATPSIRNSATTSQFAINGWIQAKAAKSSTSFTGSKANATRFAPMTPSTRKIRQAALFATDPQESQYHPHGGISIISSPQASSSREDDNSVLLWHGTTITIIPSLLTYWQNQIRGSGNLLRTSSKREIRTISNVRFSGEACNDMSLDQCSTELEIVITSGHRIIMITPSNIQRRGPSVIPKIMPNDISTNEQLLAAGELDLFGMDRVLASMWTGRSLGEIPTERSAKTNKIK